MSGNMSTRPELNLDRFMPYRLSVVTNRVSSAIAQHYSQRFDLSIPEWRVIAVLGQSPGLSARQVAQRTAMDKVQVSRAVASSCTVRVVRGGPPSMRGPLSRPGRDGRGTSQTSIRHHPRLRSAMSQYAVAGSGSISGTHCTA